MLLRRILRRVAVRSVQGGRRRARGWLLWGVVLAALALTIPLNLVSLPTGTAPTVGSLLGFGLESNPGSSLAQGVSPGRAGGESGPVARGAEPPATATYLRGMELADASLMWAAFSTTARRALQQSGGSVEATQRQLDTARTAGTQIVGAQYVGTSAIPGGSIAFYIIARSSQGQGEVAYVPYSFTLDANGKIDRVD